jgi:hypothetical protein
MSAVAQSLDKKEIFKALESRDTYGTVLHAICLVHFGEELYNMDAVEIYAQLEEEFGIWPHEDNESKIMVMITMFTTPYFFTDLTMFKITCRTLTTGDIGLTGLGIDDTTLLEVLWGVYEAGVNVHPVEFSDQINEYINDMIGLEQADNDESREDILTHYERELAVMAGELRSQLQLVGFQDMPEMPNIV